MEEPIFNFNNTYARLPEQFYAQASASVPPKPQLIAWNNSLADELQIKDSTLSKETLAQLFSGASSIEGTKPIAMAYAGHQFGHLSPELGDGRALLLGEVLGKDGLRYDIQLKGSGPTPYSRRGDGKSSLGPVLREYIVSEAMHRLGVPTTRALAAVSTGETVYREDALPGGVFTRVASSHIRVGTFEYFAYKGDLEALRVLLDYAAKRHYPVTQGSSDLPLDFFREVIKVQAELVAQWMSFGFIHGVMNTDNCSVAGITIDYGPCAFMDHYNSNQVYSSIDRRGRYAYSNQPPIAAWNMMKLAESLILLYPGKEMEAAKRFEKVLDEFQSIYKFQWLVRMTNKMGISTQESSDTVLVQSWLDYLEKEKLDFTTSFRSLSDLVDENKESKSFKSTEEFNNFLKLWKIRLAKQGESVEATQSLMNKSNPVFIPRNHHIERVIQDGIAGNFDSFNEFNNILQKPFEDADYPLFKGPPEPHQVVHQTFCGT